MSIINLLLNRRSTRDFYLNPIDKEVLKNIIDRGNYSKPLYSNIFFNVKLIENGIGFAKMLKGNAGYFGKLFDAPHYVIAETVKQEGFLENLGFRFEQFMIEAQKEGLGTCWIEVLHHHEKVKELLGIKETNKSILVLSPLGYRRASSKIKRLNNIISNKSQRKSVHEIAYLGYWANALRNEYNQYYKILEYARLAPSWANQQPWKFIVDENRLIINVKREWQVKEKDNIYRIDAGIIMLYITLISREIGLEGDWIKPVNFSKELYGIPENYETLSIFVPYFK